MGIVFRPFFEAVLSFVDIDAGDNFYGENNRVRLVVSVFTECTKALLGKLVKEVITF